MPTQCEGIIHLPTVIKFDRGAMGLELTAGVAGHTFSIAMASIEDSVGQEGPTVHPPTFTRQFRCDRITDADWTQGWVYNTELQATTASYVKAVAFRVTLDADDNDELADAAEEFRLTADRWVNELFEWLEAWSGRPLYLEPAPGLKTTGDLWQVGEPMQISGWGKMGSVAFGGSAITATMLRAAIARVAAGVLLPDQWRFYFRAGRSRDLRQGIIDASTAAELSIERALVAEMASRSDLADGEIDAVVSLASGIVEKLKLLEAIRTPLKSRRGSVSSRIAGPRNRAVHAGYHPTQQEATGVFAEARAILDVYAPLPSSDDEPS